MVPEDSSMDELLEQFAPYQIADISGAVKDRMDQTWISTGTEFPQFQKLATVMGSILAIPHRSASCERIFSTVRKNRTDQRASLLDDIREALLVLKATMCL